MLDIETTLIITVFTSIGFLIFNFRGNPIDLFAIIFIYSGVHFLYTAPGLLDGTALYSWVSQQGARVIPKALASALLLAVTAAVFISLGVRKKVGIFAVSGVVLFFMTGHLIERCCGSSRLLDLASPVAAFSLCILFTISLANTEASLAKSARRWAPAFLSILVLAALLGGIELLLGVGWARFSNSSGALVVRSSSFFFNPNWFALYVVYASLLIVVGRSYSAVSPLAVVAAGFFAAFCLFTSGSRGSLMLLAAILALWMIFETVRRSSALFSASFAVTFLSLLAGGLALDSAEKPPAIMETTSGLVQRWAALPTDLANTFIVFSERASDSELSAMTPELEATIEGRFRGGLRDNGVLAIYDDYGLLVAASLSATLAGLLLLSLFGLRSRSTRDASLIALSAVLLVIGSSIYTRAFQVFPIWISVSCLLAVASSLVWRTELWISIVGFQTKKKGSVANSSLTDDR